jgi:hypothetical protein
MEVSSAPGYQRTNKEDKALQAFLEEHFDSQFDESQLSDAERDAIGDIVDYVRQRFSGKKLILGLALDFILLSQQVSEDTEGQYDRNLTIDQLFEQYDRVKERGGVELNTLTLSAPSGDKYGIRGNEERILALFHDELDRLDYTSAYVYNTGQWHKHKDLLTLCFRLSEVGRYVALERLVDFGLVEMPRATSFEGNTRPRLFPAAIKNYPRSEIENENSGVIFQGITYGFVKADRPHLSIVADKVRTGSKRQKRIGDIDCYLDVKVEMSIEVKDLHMSEGIVQKQLGTFVQDVRQGGILGAVFVRSISDDVRDQLEDEGILVRTQSQLLNEISLWDWPKQDSALRGLLHYLAHIEQNPEAVRRLQWFIYKFDPEHSVLHRFNPEEGEPPAYQQELELD